MTSCSQAWPLAADLNQHCACSAVDPTTLRHALALTPELAAWLDAKAQTHPHLFASTMVFISKAQQQAMQAVVSAVHELAQSDVWVSKTLSVAPRVASAVTPKSRGVFLGFDFHLQTDGAQLIEINTNAGGALLNGALAKAQKSCCTFAEALFEAASLPAAVLDEAIMKMFRQEWRLQRGNQPLRTIAIVDDAPNSQFLAPEFLLFKQLFARNGIDAFIVDSIELKWHAGQLWLGDCVVDLVYNRTTDFYFEEPQHTALLEAYKTNSAVITPHPRAHAVFANKQNLTWLGDEAALKSIGATEATTSALQRSVPHAVMVTMENANQLWADRKKYFFKPIHGFGSKAAYRGEKLTKQVWREILQGDYIAQMLVIPSQRLIAHDLKLKADIRAYAYEGQIQLFAARLYQGQTTNMRTEFGGFAPVFSLPV